MKVDVENFGSEDVDEMFGEALVLLHRAWKLRWVSVPIGD